jgi:hypothetical protein
MLYVYGVVRDNGKKIFDITPLTGAAEVRTGPASSGLAFLSSDIGDLRPRASRMNLLAHTRVLEAVMEEMDVLPVRFGTLIESDCDGERVLADNKDEFARAFAEIEGHCEISLKINWGQGAVFEEVMERNPALRRERDAMNQGSGDHYSKIDFGKKIENAIAEIRARDRAIIVHTLKGFADKFVEGAMLDDSMVVNLSFLVARDALSAFDAAVEKLDATHSGRWQFRYVGPMPTFSFVDLRIDFAPEKVDS